MPRVADAHDRALAHVDRVARGGASPSTVASDSTVSTRMI
jgi:hypothetical protein